MMHTCLSIAGFDGSGGAGLQADLKTFSAFGCYGMTVLTALPVQNTVGVRRCYEIPLPAIQEQLEAIFEDIVPQAIKIGMLFSYDIVELVARFLRQHAANIPIVVDPVMFAKSGDALLLPEAMTALKTQLLPLARIVTPNLPEAYALVGAVCAPPNMQTLAQDILKLSPHAVLLKGGHANTTHADDFYLDQQGQQLWLHGERIDSKNTHGTGCTLSAAITSCLALGMELPEACRIAKRYLFHALQAAQTCSVGKGQGPVHHFYHLWPAIDKVILPASA